MNDFRMCPAWVGPNNCWANFIWIDKDFNRDSLKNKDIINKIIILRGTYVASEAPHNGTYAKPAAVTTPACAIIATITVISIISGCLTTVKEICY